MAALYASVFSGFIDETIPECGEFCPYSSECYERFLLVETGEVKPWPWAGPECEPDFWAMWPTCPRHYMGEKYIYRVERGSGYLAEVCRWQYEKGAHKSDKINARGLNLIREWSRIKDLPSTLREKMAIDKLKKKGGK